MFLGSSKKMVPSSSICFQGLYWLISLIFLFLFCWSILIPSLCYLSILIITLLNSLSENSSMSFICTINVGLEICRGDTLSWFFIWFQFPCYELYIWSTLLAQVFLFFPQFLPFNCPSPPLLLFVQAAFLLSVEACIRSSKGLRGSNVEMHSILHGLMQNAL